MKKRNWIGASGRKDKSDEEDQSLLKATKVDCECLLQLNKEHEYKSGKYITGCGIQRYNL